MRFSLSRDVLVVCATYRVLQLLGRRRRLSGLKNPRNTVAKSEITFTMRAIWKGSISFGLVNIPIALYPATKKEELKFRLLRGKDLSPVNYKRVAEKDGKEVPWDEIVKGYEYEKGKFVVLKDEDFAARRSRGNADGGHPGFCRCRGHRSHVLL